MESYEAAGADASKTQRAVKNPSALQAAEGLLAFWKEFGAEVLH